VNARWSWLATALLVGSLSAPVDGAPFTPFLDRTSFLGALGTVVLDDYSSAGYQLGDVVDAALDDFHSDVHMSAVVGETDYVTTGWENLNIITQQDIDPYYCAGCNGSFLLDFGSTSVGSPFGVFGVGFDYFNHAGFYSALVTFGDGSTSLFSLSDSSPDDWQFLGITSPVLIQSIHVSHDLLPTIDGSFGLDNLTLGGPAPAALVPEPATFALLATSLVPVVLSSRRKRKSRS